jgi:predicted DNA-binding WGR domain protein
MTDAMNSIMRRYEISGEKFWQYELTGTEALIEWGKIGGTGKQRQHKQFASEQVATSELAKLVAKKEAEGFAEVGKTAAAPAAAPAAKPAPKAKATPAPAATPAASPAARVVLTEEAKSTASGERGLTVLDLSAGKAAWLAELAAQFGKPDDDLKADFERGLNSSSATETCRGWARRMLETYGAGKEPKELDADADGAAMHECTFTALASYLLARGGLAYLAKVMLAAGNISAPWDSGAHGADARYFAQNATGNIYRGGIEHQIAAVIRGHLGSAKDGDEARRIIEQAYASVRLPMRIVCAHALGSSDWANALTEAYLAAKPADVSYDYVEQLFQIVRDPALVTRLAKRHPGSVPSALLIDDMGLDATDAVVAAHAKDTNATWVTDALACIESVPAAKELAESLGKKRAAQAAKDYFTRRPDLAVAVLEPIIKNDAKLAPFARPVLEAVRRANPSLGGGEPAKPKAKVTTKVPDVLARPIALKKPVTLPEWASNLPQVLLADGTALPDDAVRNLLLVLHQSTAKEPHAAIVDVKRACDPQSLAEFVWALFESWLGIGGASKEGWAFAAVGHLGDDDCARKLAPLVRAWPGESQHARAVVGLDVLGAIGTDVALMHLHGIAQKVKFKGLQEKARAKMDELAKARGLTAEELADRLVPDLGLDETGSLTLDFGARTFTVGFDEELKPFVLDTSGARLGDLPKPNKNDDASQAKEATERFKTLKKDARTVASTQIVRLEIAMCTQRRWSGKDFKAFIVDHPLVVHLARRLVWGSSKTTFRVAEDRTFVSADDKDVKLPESVGLMHRLDMDDKGLASWGDHFGRYELLQPFDQLGRALFTIDDKEKKSDSLNRTKGMKVKTGKVLGLETRGWRKGPPQDAGWVWEMNKTIGGYELTLPLGGGLCMGWHEGTPSEQELGAVGISGKDGKKASFGMLTPVVFSEVVRELQMLREE